jgi:hypothetical protein
VSALSMLNDIVLLALFVPVFVAEKFTSEGGQ